MNDSAAAGARPAVPHLFTALALLWFAGLAMRLPLLAVPPVIPLIHNDLHMSETQVGALIGLPLVMFALAAVPGSLLIARLGVKAVAAIGLAAATLASAARAIAFDIGTLYAATVALGFGIAILQPALPTLVRAWTPARMWLASAVYTNGMLIGVTLGPALTIPLVLPLVGGSWRADLLAWSAPGLLATLCFVFAAWRWRQGGAAIKPKRGATVSRWWPDWKSRQIWLLGVTLGVNNAQFYAANAFVPEYLHSLGRGDMIGETLGWMNGAQLAASFVLLGTAENLQRQSWPFTVFGPLTIAGVLGILFFDGIWVVMSAALLGFAAAVTFVVTFGLPAILSPPDEVHRMASGMFTISYTIAVLTPIICGAAWDITGLPWTAFVPIGLCGVIITISGVMLTAPRAHSPSAPARRI